MSKILVFSLLLLVVQACSCGERSPEKAGAGAAEAAIRAAMAEQVVSWNSGDLSGFMKYYWRSGEMTFQGGKKRLQGWEKLDSMYAGNYSGDQRGVLEFSEIEIEVLSDEAAYVLGDWKVELPDTSKQGKFTLIWMKIGGKWRIVHDHSS